MTCVQITYTDEFVNFLRLVYYAVQLGTLVLAYLFIRNKILQKNDKTKIFLPPVLNPFAPAEAETARPKESTYLEHELEQVSMLVRSTLIGIAMVSFMHFKVGVKPVLVSPPAIWWIDRARRTWTRPNPIPAPEQNS